MATTPKFIKRSAITGITAIAVLALTFTSCDDGEIFPSEDTGTFRVILHDEPGDFEELWVDVQRVEVHRQQEAESGWTVVSEPDQRYNILELINGAQEILGEEELEEGTYRQIRLILGEDNTILVNGEEHNLQVPSGMQSGIKINIDADITPGTEYNLLLDFDAKRSVVQRGQAQAGAPYLLRPVIRASHEAATGNISGDVEPVESHPWIHAVVGDDTLSTTRADNETGEFMLVGLEEDTYDVHFDPAEGFEPEITEDVEVTARDTTELGTVELSEENNSSE